MSEPEPAPHLPPANVLWGRVATAIVVVLLAFSFGRCSADGVPEEEVAQLDREVNDLQTKNDQLRARVAGLNDQLSEQETAASAPTETSAPAPEPGEGEPGGTYTVASGDTLNAIAERVYGDPGMGEQVAEANNLQPGETLQVGQTLLLPPAAE